MKNKTQVTNKNKLLFVAILSILLATALSFAVNAAYLNASITTNAGAIQDVYYTTSGNAYKDSVGSTPNVYITVCADTQAELTNKPVAAFYLVAANSSSELLSDIMGGGNVAGFVNFGSTTGSGPYCAKADFNFFTTRAPYPAAAYAVVDTNNNNTEWFDYGTDEIIPIFTSNGYLKGSYSLNSVETTYNQSNGYVKVDANSATAYTGPSTTTSPTQTSQNKLLLGICTDSVGYNCTDTVRTTLASTTDHPLATGVITPGDSYITYRYAVANGLGYSFCIGPDLYISLVGRSPTSGYPGTWVNISATVTNRRTVDVTQSFNVTFKVSGSPVGTTTLTGLAAGASKITSILWNSVGQTTGTKAITFTLDDSNIGDCYDSNDNTLTTNFQVLTAYFAHVWIDGVYTTTFNDTGRPYNVTINFNNSDGFNVANATLKLYEENGYSIFAPIQLFNSTGVGQNGVKTVSIAEIITDINGMASFAAIPTGNKLYAPEYAYKNTLSHVGNYSIYLEAFSPSGSEYQLVSGGSAIDNLPFNIQNSTPRNPTTSEMYTLRVFNQADVKVMLNFVYQGYANARRWLTLT